MPKPELKPNCYGQYRQLLIADVENLLSDPNPSLNSVKALHTRVEAFLHKGNVIPTQEAVAYSHFAAGSFRIGWPTGRHKIRSGKDGADLALLEYLSDLDYIRERYSRVIIASGDGIFAPAAEKLADAGIRVAVVSKLKNLSSQLGMRAHTVYPLRDLDRLCLAT